MYRAYAHRQARALALPTLDCGGTLVLFDYPDSAAIARELQAARAVAIPGRHEMVVRAPAGARAMVVGPGVWCTGVAPLRVPMAPLCAGDYFAGPFAAR
jgi:hypothetical protein